MTTWNFSNCLFLSSLVFTLAVLSLTPVGEAAPLGSDTLGEKRPTESGAELGPGVASGIVELLRIMSGAELGQTDFGQMVS